MKKILVAGVIVLMAGLAAFGQFHYGFYYDLSEGRDLEINLMNTMPWENEVWIEVHDAFGNLIWESYGPIPSLSTVYVRLGDDIPAGATHWGVVTIDSTDRVVIGLEYFADGDLISVDTIYNEIPIVDPDVSYWIGSYYSQVIGSETAFVVMNPWPSNSLCMVTAYNASGVPVYQREFWLAPYESEFVALGQEIGSGSLLYGLLDVRLDGQLVVLAIEYHGRGCSGLEIDNVTEFYF